jgi:hypothetical protein
MRKDTASLVGEAAGGAVPPHSPAEAVVGAGGPGGNSSHKRPLQGCWWSCISKGCLACQQQHLIQT